MKLGYTILYVADVPKTMDFWERAFGLKRRFLDESGAFGQLDTGETALAFVAGSYVQETLPGGFRPTDAKGPPPSFEVGLVTDDPAAAQARALAAGATLVMKPTKKPWGQTVAYVRDLDGHLVELCTPITPP